MKILWRLEKPPLCNTFETWLSRNALSTFVLFVFLMSIFSWLADKAKTDPDMTEDSRTFLIVLAVIFAIPSVFYLLQFIGVAYDKEKLLQIFQVYGFIQLVAYFLFFLAGGILLMVKNSDYGLGFGAIAFGVVFAGIGYYALLINYTVICIFKERKSSRPQPSNI